MNVQQLREALEGVPDHLPVFLGVQSQGTTVAGVDFLYSLDCKVEAFPTIGRIVVVYVNHEPR